MAAPLWRCGRLTARCCRVPPLSCHQQRLLNTGHGFLPRFRPLPVLVVTGGGYYGYQHYRRKGQQDDGAPPSLATPTQYSEHRWVKGQSDVTVMMSFRPVKQTSAWTLHSGPAPLTSPYRPCCFLIGRLSQDMIYSSISNWAGEREALIGPKSKQKKK